MTFAIPIDVNALVEGILKESPGEEFKSLSIDGELRTITTSGQSIVIYQAVASGSQLNNYDFGGSSVLAWQFISSYELDARKGGNYNVASNNI